jgi:hypothetical protein
MARDGAQKACLSARPSHFLFSVWLVDAWWNMHSGMYNWHYEVYWPGIAKKGIYAQGNIWGY